MTPIPFKTYIQFYHTAAWNTCEDVLQDPGPVWEYGLPGAAILDLVADTGTLTFTLDNSTGNAAGLAGYYTIGHANCPAWFVDGLAVRVRCERQDDMTIATRFVGNIVASRPTSGLYLEQTVEVEARDWMDFAHSQKMGAVGIELDIRAGAAITTALTKCGVQPTATDLDVGTELWAYMFNSDDSLRMSVASLLQKIARNEGGGWIYVKGDGTLTFDNRSVRELAAQAFALDPVHELETAFDRNDVINKLEIEVHPRYMDAAATTVIWELREPFSMAAGEVVKLTCPYRDPDTGARISAIDVEDTLFVDGTYCTGGTVTQVGDQRIHTFTGDGTLVVVNPGTVKCLVVGGGGGAGYNAGGGGGAGGLAYDAAHAVTVGNKAVTVGAGGAGATLNDATPGTTGGDSIFDGVTAKGGGGGVGYGANGVAGGSGGGCGSYNGTARSGGHKLAAQGNDAGDATSGAGTFGATGGGGAGAASADAAASRTNGGAGLEYAQYSTVGGSPAGWFAGGGAAKNAAAGGAGGGGASDTNGTANTGGGGGGDSKAGGSGIVIVSYTYTVVPYYNVKFGSVSDGSTNDLIASLTATQEIGGNTDVITLTAAVAGYVNFLEIIGRGIYDYEPMVSTAEDATSIAAYGDRPLSVDLEQVSNPSTARIMGNYYLTLFKSPQQRIDRVRFLANYDDDYATAALTVEPNVKFGITESLSATTDDYIATRLRFEAVGPLLWVEILPAIDPTTAGEGAGVNWFYWDTAGHGWDEGQWVF